MFTNWHLNKSLKLQKKFTLKKNTSLTIRKMQMNTTMKYHYIHIRIIKIRNTDNGRLGGSDG